MEKLWPKSASALSRRIGEIKPTLRELEIEIYDTQDSKTRIKILHIRRKIEVSKMPPCLLLPPEPLISSEKAEDESNGKSDTSGILHTSNSQPKHDTVSTGGTGVTGGSSTYILYIQRWQENSCQY